MTLARVGAGRGPDIGVLERLVAQGACEVFAAGGVRDGADLVAASRAGARGALVATALHDGRLDAAALAQSGMIGKKSRPV
jgi:phosphoribosylformimino-5-aminoimidazole carboxamide ribotide isomerase